MDGSECRCTALVMQRQIGRMHTPKYCGNISSTGGVACPCSFFSRVGGVRIVVHGDDFMSGGPRHQLKWQEGGVDNTSSRSTL